MELELVKYYQFIEYPNINLCESLSDKNSWNLQKLSELMHNNSPRKLKKYIFQSFPNKKESIDILLDNMINKHLK